MGKIDLHSASKLLSNKEQTLALIDFVIKETFEEKKKDVEDAGGAQYDDTFCQIYVSTLNIIHKKNIEAIYNHTESEIERIFLNSLVLSFINGNPFNLFVTTPFYDTPAQIKQTRDHYKNFLAYWAKYQKVTGDKNWNRFDKFLDILVQKGAMTPMEKKAFITCVFLTQGMDSFDAFHLTLQAGFPDIKVDGKAIRADMLIWIPNNEQFKLVVECDGFEFHSSKESFIADRKRERILKANGYDVLRYAGSEIYNDPVGTSSDLFEYLSNAVKDSRNTPQVQNMVSTDKSG